MESPSVRVATSWSSANLTTLVIVTTARPAGRSRHAWRSTARSSATSRRPTSRAAPQVERARLEHERLRLADLRRQEGERKAQDAGLDAAVEPCTGQVLGPWR
ncbi:hypothetical protein FSW04_21395 [Baekduia soli]|uniref:Uncharacterized protein n=1 Tax=Baekduia soli TaxID=496014 RepID=A0A5B8U9Z5_9ACTN|nr:hypothetical protein [Baekduia soli]QEC49870.1 hypothetical protein FSW04_21395 [Baekduia soli]